MKVVVFICVMFLFTTGCALNQANQDSFVSLRSRVKRILGDSYDCGAINAEAGSSRYFDVTPRSKGLLITVTERKFLSQNEWEKCYASGMKLISQTQVMAVNPNHPIDAKTVIDRLDDASNLLKLPEWHYQRIGVDVSVQEVEVVYPGLRQDVAEAEKRRREIVRLLRPYHQPRQ